MNRIIKIFFIAFCVLFLSKHSFAQPIPDNIVQQIAAYLKGETGATFSFYFRRVNSTIKYDNIKDPYGTFGSSIVFAASAREEEAAPFGLVGLYKDGEVVWYSERITFPNHFTSGEISKIGDINRDGKAEILSVWDQHYDGIFGRSYGWVFSWDGNTGKRINEVDEDGYSTLISHESGSFSLTDLNGDGIWEIYSSIPETDIPIQSYEYHYYKWNGSMYEELSYEPSLEELKFVPKDNIVASIIFSFELFEDTFKYFYRIKNHGNSVQSVADFYLQNIPKDNISVDYSSNWFYSKARRTDLIVWKVVGEIPNYVTPSDTSSAFSITSKGLPKVVKYFLRGANRSPLLGEISFEEEVNDIYRNSFAGFTIAPRLPDSTVSIEAFADSLRSYHIRSCGELEWITNQGICNSLQAKLENVAKQLGKDKIKQAVNGLNAFLNEVSAQRGKHITSEGYALLWFNGRHLLEQLDGQRPGEGNKKNN